MTTRELNMRARHALMLLQSDPGLTRREVASLSDLRYEQMIYLVNARLAKVGKKMPPRVHPEDVAEARRLFHQGLTGPEIAERMVLSKATAYNYLELSGLYPSHVRL